jgi:serine/threonine protein kinase
MAGVPQFEIPPDVKQSDPLGKYVVVKHINKCITMVSPKTDPTDKFFAMKKIEFWSDPAKLEKILHGEVSAMRSISDDVTASEFCCTHHEFYIFDGAVYIIMDLAESDLTKLVARSSFYRRSSNPDIAVLSSQQIVEILESLLSALKSLSDLDLLHRDIKSDNALVCQDPREHGNVRFKLADFGFAAPIGQHDSPHGTPQWMAPELAKNLTNGMGMNTTQTETWSLGCLLLELLCGEPPFINDDARTVFEKTSMLTAPPVPDDVKLGIQGEQDVPFAALMCSMLIGDGTLKGGLLAINPDERPTYDEIIDRIQKYYRDSGK